MLINDIECTIADFHSGASTKESAIGKLVNIVSSNSLDAPSFEALANFLIDEQSIPNFNRFLLIGNALLGYPKLKVEDHSLLNKLFGKALGLYSLDCGFSSPNLALVFARLLSTEFDKISNENLKLYFYLCGQWSHSNPYATSTFKGGDLCPMFDLFDGKYAISSSVSSEFRPTTINQGLMALFTFCFRDGVSDITLESCKEDFNLDSFLIFSREIERLHGCSTLVNHFDILLVTQAISRINALAEHSNNEKDIFARSVANLITMLIPSIETKNKKCVFQSNKSRKLMLEFQYLQELHKAVSCLPVSINCKEADALYTMYKKRLLKDSLMVVKNEGDSLAGKQYSKIAQLLINISKDSLMRKKPLKGFSPAERILLIQHIGDQDLKLHILNEYASARKPTLLHDLGI